MVCHDDRRLLLLRYSEGLSHPVLFCITTQIKYTYIIDYTKQFDASGFHAPADCPLNQDDGCKPALPRPHVTSRIFFACNCLYAFNAVLPAILQSLIIMLDNTALGCRARNMASAIEPNPVNQIQQRHAATEHLMQQLTETKTGASAFVHHEQQQQRCQPLMSRSLHADDSCRLYS